MAPMIDYVAKSRAAWGILPAWVETLADAVNASSQVDVSVRLGLSNSLISQVLSNSYRGDMAAVSRRVAGALMGERVTCPVMGDIGRDHCEREQGRPFAATSALRTHLFHACRSGCPNAKPTPLKG
ncbi:MAG: transcriptional regulator [Hyphomicrobiales bacterium]|nr:transcriptional regulator [Hyphomicrobiales bacterium]MDE2113855.1 transcriptional regulator [Hyphomicrobiales bacterium]